VNGKSRTDVVGDLTLEHVAKAGIGYGDLLVDLYDEHDQPTQKRLGEISLPMLRDYDHIPTPLPPE
jgi:hypothetical protein